MVLDIHGPVAGAACRGHQEVGLACPPAVEIDGQAPGQDERRAGLHRAGRGVLPAGRGLTRDRVRRRVRSEKPGDDLGLELPTSCEPPLEHRRIRPGLGRPDEIPLDPDRAPLGHITALRRHARRVVAGAHRPMLLGARAPAGDLLRPHVIRIVLPRNRVMKRQQVTFCLKEQHRHVNRRVDWICLSVGDDAGVLEWWQASIPRAKPPCCNRWKPCGRSKEDL